MLRGQVVACAAYRRGDWTSGGGPRPAVDGAAGEDGTAAASDFAEEVLSAPPPGTPAAFVLDVGRLGHAAGPWAVVEANPVCSSATYGADPAAVLPVLAAACFSAGP